jgi:hypothetical protein
MSFAGQLASIAAVLAAAGLVGWGAAAALVPRGAGGRAERFAWGIAAGLALVALSVPVAFALKWRPGWLPFLVLSTFAVLGSRVLRVRGSPPTDSVSGRQPVTVVLGLLLAAGVALYALRALTEPMWANDYLAIWGLKGKTIFAGQGFPQQLFRATSLSFSHPEYPLGLPFLYAGISFLAGRWDDHAMALLFPLLQVATLAALGGWLRRRGATPQLALGATALLSLFEPLYRGFTTGMAEVPLSLSVLLLGCALSDRVDRTDLGATRRLALASVLCAATKNEGLFFVAAGIVVAAISALSRRGVIARAAAILALPAALVVAGHRLLRGSLPLIDFDFTLLSRPAILAGRMLDTLRAVFRLAPAGVWIGLAALAVLVAAGRRSAPGARLLALALCGVAAYLVLPAFAVAGPAWLVQTAFFRTTAALAPLVAAGVAIRLAPEIGKRETGNGRRS